VLSFSPITIDGLHFSGARGDNTMEHDFEFDRDGITNGIVGGIGAFLGAATTFINNEVDDCDIGIMLGGKGSVQLAPHGQASPDLLRKLGNNLSGTAALAGQSVFSHTVNSVSSWLANTDSDGDGVNDDMDQYPNSILKPMVIIDGRISGIMNSISPCGCTISDDIRWLANDAKNRSEFGNRVTP
jgi:hypothetical protein